MKVKICGITNHLDGIMAAEAGADMLGFNFYPGSPRYVEVGLCQDIAAEMRKTFTKVKLVGVFVNASPEMITNTLASCGLDYAQVTGDSEIVQSTISRLAGFAYPALRLSSSALNVAEQLPFALTGQNNPVDIPDFLVDAHSPGMYGGTGQVANWKLAAELAKRYAVFLAGGLTPDNVCAAIQQVKPWGVDVASGVEMNPRSKDREKVAMFIKNAKTCPELEAFD